MPWQVLELRPNEDMASYIKRLERANDWALTVALHQLDDATRLRRLFDLAASNDMCRNVSIA